MPVRRPALMQEAVKLLKKPLRTVRTFFMTGFLPWRIGSYLADGKRGAISNAFEVSGWAVGFYIATFFIVTETSREEHVWVQVVLYVIIVSTAGYLLVMFHGLLRALGSTQRLSKTFVAAAYPIGFAFLVVAVLARLKIGVAYAVLAFADPNQIPAWQKPIDIILSFWVMLINVIIQSRVHSIRWYKTLGCVLFMWPFAVGWQEFLQYLFMEVLP